MRVERYPFNYPIEKNFPNQRVLAEAEGGAVLLAEKDCHIYIIIDERSMADFFYNTAEADMGNELVGVYEFDTEDERQAYIVERGWEKLAGRKQVR